MTVRNLHKTRDIIQPLASLLINYSLPIITANQSTLEKEISIQNSAERLGKIMETNRPLSLKSKY